MSSYIKHFFVCATVITFFVIFYCSNFLNNYKNNSTPITELKKVNTMKYILQWTLDSNVPFVDMGKGREGFVSRNCYYTNCFVTSNRTYLQDYRQFDVVVFSGPELSQQIFYNVQKPTLRSSRQKYVFASIESPAYYPICTKDYDNFFNWTWTYKLNSEVRWGYVVIRDLRNNVIGPNENMKWLKPEEMSPVSDLFKNTLKTKRKAAAWFASNCNTRNHRHTFVHKLQNELQIFPCGNETCKVDVYGDCGTFRCSRAEDEVCNNIIKDKYYFYLAFENSFGRDYVTEKLLRALNNNAVPIVFGAANYTRFLPDGSYLNARQLGVKKLAAKMYELVKDPDRYADYFRWKNHYIYHRTTDAVDTNEYCRFCELLNDDKALKEHSVYRNFRQWWNDRPSNCKGI